MWTSIVKIVGGSILATAVVWALVLGWWQANDYQPGKLDLLLYLGAIPLALIGGFLLLKGFIEHLKAPPAPVEKPVSPAIADDDPLASSKAKVSAAERSFSAALIEAWVSTPVGKDAPALIEACREGKRPGLSDEFNDQNGFPVFLAELPDLDTDELAEALPATSPELAGLAEQTHTLRTLALVESIMNSGMEQIPRQLESLDKTAKLRVVWLTPAHWESNTKLALREWLKTTCLRGIDPDRLEISMPASTSDIETLGKLDEIILTINREQLSNDLFLLVGGHSNIDEAVIESWEAGRRLFTAENQQGDIPGEGAAALLLGSELVLKALDQEQSVRVSRLSQAQRDKPINSPGRIKGTLIEQLLHGLLTVSHIEAASVKTIISDADHHSNPLVELLEGLGETFDHLDPAKDQFGIAAVTGTLSPVGSLLAVACAREQCSSNESNVIVVSNRHDIERGTLLFSPIVPNDSTTTNSGNT
jgi:hypothetical protein